MESLEILQRLHSLGYFSGTGLKVTDLPKITLTSQFARDAITRYQKFMTGSVVTDDGNSPQFAEVMAIPRCGFPDFPVNDADERLYATDTPLEANWPISCRMRLKYGRVFETVRGLTKTQVDQMLIAAMNCWNYSLEVSLTPNGENWAKSGAHVWCDAAPLSGSTLAWSYLANNDCNSPKQQRINSGRSWEFWFAVTTMAHEIGHVLGHQHLSEAGALMRPEINQQSLARKGWQAAADFGQSKRLGYTVKNTSRPADEVMIRIPGSDPGPTPGPGPSPTPGPTPANPFANFRMVDQSTGNQFLIVPAPKF